MEDCIDCQGGPKEVATNETNFGDNTELNLEYGFEITEAMLLVMDTVMGTISKLKSKLLP